MLSRKLALSLTLLLAVTAPAFATSGTSYASTNFGFATHSMPPSNVTRTQVQAELADWNKKQNALRRAGLLTTDQNGNSYGPTDTHSYQFVNGTLTHADALLHDTPRPSAAMTAEEKRQLHGLYGGR